MSHIQFPLDPSRRSGGRAREARYYVLASRLLMYGHGPKKKKETQQAGTLHDNLISMETRRQTLSKRPGSIIALTLDLHVPARRLPHSRLLPSLGFESTKSAACWKLNFRLTDRPE